MKVKDGYKETKIGIIPCEWEITRLDDICTILDFRRKPIKASERKHGPFPYYGASGIIDWVDNYIFDEELILLGEDGANIVNRNSPLAFRVSGKCWVNNHAHIFCITQNDRDNIDFITMVLESKDYSGITVGSAQPKITQDQCANLVVQRPPLPEQRKIADILTTVDEHISETESLIDKTKVLKQGMMQRLLTRGIGHTEFKDTQIGRIPVEWKVDSLVSYISDHIEKTTTSNQYPVLTSAREGLILQTDYFKNQVTTNDNVGYFVIPKGYCTYRSRSDDGIFKFNCNEIIDRGIISYFYPVFRFIGLNTYFALTYMNTKLQGQIQKEIVGTSQLVLSMKKLKSLYVVIPPLPEQNHIASILKTIDDQTDTYQSKLSALNRLKTGLMQQLLTGKIRVKT